MVHEEDFFLLLPLNINQAQRSLEIYHFDISIDKEIVLNIFFYNKSPGNADKNH